MPEMDGIECARQILAIDPAAKVVIFSGYEPSHSNLPSLLDQKLLKGYLTKPVDIAELSHFLTEVLNEKK
jgi:YesN/AraC family two-component response regulator